ncbi:conserved hypothetical protein [Verticillium alfalfae VaMs.102]|uniref:Major facilitator superfamily (MFS) profile domain-containing protein n=1 Tax=Verticillium alfalfae (strain VaMs.102 / ATCC MYA-4576 / FGSC 10136) TaxID=526221 RepID=C9S5Y3_VERA1|nr:conserved hypothetical protein [Verticillium alfalfae VaMs.102]EEY14322.1 conserved hypothetical protein [Verticillium alfalfae VaMs.102]
MAVAAPHDVPKLIPKPAVIGPELWGRAVPLSDVAALSSDDESNQAPRILLALTLISRYLSISSRLIQLDETLRDPGTGVVPTSAPDPSPAPIVVAPPDGPSKPVAWRDLPRKNQLLVITLARLSEPLVHTSLTAYMFYQLKWFDPSLSDAVIASQAGVLHASFTAAQFTTALLWGRLADSPVFGRKMALCFRLLGGVTNGNVGVMRTMISEIIRDKKYQSRAFLILPMTFNVGVIIGPILGGLLSDPAGSYPSVFGQVEFFKKYPYAAPNLVSAVFLFTAMASIWLFLEEHRLSTPFTTTAQTSASGSD